jgi:hypothetical protein
MCCTSKDGIAGKSDPEACRLRDIASPFQSGKGPSTLLVPPRPGKLVHKTRSLLTATSTLSIFILPLHPDQTLE